MCLQIVLMGRQVQSVIRNLLHRKAARGGWGNTDRHIGLTPRQVEDARQSDDLEFQFRVLIRYLGTNLWQNVVGATIRRTDPNRSGQGLPCPAQFGHASRKRPLRDLGMGKKALSCVGQAVSLGRLYKQWNT